jgi:Domain of unknown function (DUF4349)
MSRLARWPRSRPLAALLAVVILGAIACTTLAPGLGPRLGGPALAPAAAPGRAGDQPAPTSAPAQARALPAAAPAAQSGGVPNQSGGASAQANPAGASADAVGSTLPDLSQATGRMVIRTAKLTIEVPDVEQALAAARQIAQQAGGFVSASNTRTERTGDQDQTVVDLTLQVRSDSADASLTALRALGKVTGESSDSQDVTEEYVDLDANLRNLRASETAILALMDKATRIEDVLQLQRELTNVRGQIERLQGRQRYLERRSDMATITLSLRPPGAGQARPTTTGFDPLAVVLRGWQASLNLLRGVAEVVLLGLAFSWWLVPLLAVPAYLWLRRRRPQAGT